jgi:uncharacterized membrane-anchored protein
MKKCLLLSVLILSSVSGFAADSPPPDAAAQRAQIQKLVDSIKPQKGEIVLGDGLAKASLPPSIEYLTPNDTKTVLVQLWGNPESGRTLGMLVPKGFDPMADESWAVVMTFEEDGYVHDNDAAKIDYSKMLDEMKESTRESSKERVEQGYGAIELIGWAAPPRYDAVAKKLYWAKELKFGESTENTLNYNIRLLGRRGVLVLNAVAGINQLKAVEAATPGILAAVNFQDGHRYADFNESTDKVATYGLAALVAGGIAAKAGFFKGLIVAALAMKKFLIIGLIALFAAIKKIWSWVQGRNSARALDSTPPSA